MAYTTIQDHYKVTGQRLIVRAQEACVNKVSQHQGLIGYAEYQVLKVSMVMMNIGAISTRALNAFPTIVN